MSRLFEDMEKMDTDPKNIPADIYHQLLSLPYEKQQKIMVIISDIMKLLD